MSQWEVWVCLSLFVIIFNWPTIVYRVCSSYCPPLPPLGDDCNVSIPVTTGSVKLTGSWTSVRKIWREVFPALSDIFSNSEELKKCGEESLGRASKLWATTGQLAGPGQAGLSYHRDLSALQDSPQSSDGRRAGKTSPQSRSTVHHSRYFGDHSENYSNNHPVELPEE